MTDEEKILSNSVTTALDRSDKAVVLSFALLAVGLFAINGSGTAEQIKLPGNLTATSAEQGAIILLAMNFVNGIRYFFYLNRVAKIAKLLSAEISKALSSHPAFGTSNVMTEVPQTLLLTALTALLTLSAFEWGGNMWLILLVALFGNLPFILGAIQMLDSLNFRDR